MEISINKFDEQLNKANRVSSVKYQYELVSFIEHFGAADFGHYVSYRKFYDKWLNINDPKVKFIDKQTLFESANPYMCFYRLVKEN